MKLFTVLLIFFSIAASIHAINILNWGPRKWGNFSGMRYRQSVSTDAVPNERVEKTFIFPDVSSMKLIQEQNF